MSTMSGIFERRPGFRGWSQPKFVASLGQEANPLRSKASSRVQQLLWLVLGAVETAGGTLLVNHASPPSATASDSLLSKERVSGLSGSRSLRAQGDTNRPDTRHPAITGGLMA